MQGAYSNNVSYIRLSHLYEKYMYEPIKIQLQHRRNLNRKMKRQYLEVHLSEWEETKSGKRARFVG